MVDPSSKMNKLKYGTLVKTVKHSRIMLQRNKMKKFLSEIKWANAIGFIFIATLSAYLSLMVYQKYFQKKQIFPTSFNKINAVVKEKELLDDIFETDPPTTGNILYI